jgi:hypothetical protein
VLNVIHQFHQQLTKYLLLFSSIPQEFSELIQINLLALEAKNYAMSQLVISETEAAPGALIFDVDSQRKRVSIDLSGDFSSSISTPGSISLLGSATVKDTSPGTPSLTTQFTLELEIGENVRAISWCILDQILLFWVPYRCPFSFLANIAPKHCPFNDVITFSEPHTK